MVLLVLGVTAVSLAVVGGILYLILAACGIVGTTNGNISSVVYAQVVDGMFVERPCSLRDWLMARHREPGCVIGRNEDVGVPFDMIASSHYKGTPSILQSQSSYSRCLRSS